MEPGADWQFPTVSLRQGCLVYGWLYEYNYPRQKSAVGPTDCKIHPTVWPDLDSDARRMQLAKRYPYAANDKRVPVSHYVYRVSGTNHIQWVPVTVRK